MGYWNAVEAAAGMGNGLPWVIVGVVIGAVALLALEKTTRKRVGLGLLLFIAGLTGSLIAAAIARWGPGAEGAAYRWVRFISMLMMGAGIINLAGVLLFKALLRPIRLEPPPIMRDLILAGAYIILMVSLLSRVGVNLTGIVATSAVATAIIGFSLADTLGNIMGGMALQMERSITVGDWIRVGQHEGIVREIRWRQTSIETRGWDTVIIPNSQLMKGDVVVLGRRAGQPRQVRQSVLFNVDFRHAPTDVIDTVEAALRNASIPDAAASPPPGCIVLEFRDSYAVYSLRYWCVDIERTEPTNSAVRARIHAALKRRGISLSIPAQQVFFTSDSERRRRRKAGEEAVDKLGVLEGVALLAPLTDDERRELAGRLKVAPFVKGETITRQGATAHHLYILSKGAAEVQVGLHGAAQRVATLKPGDVFGEMGLMTGEPRSATVVAETDVVCYRLDKEAFVGILKRRPEVAEAISAILAHRKAELDAVREGLGEQARRQREKAGAGELLKKIRSFFGMT